ncbi:MAG TPA: ATP-binding protein [Candidatus Saccharimonas sp.]|jgi:two-component system phosphate regulon sensor histidine kinase PhoR|nr:ATP-binding protein [Candidatus Saccharimonas sp.]
MMKRAGLSVNQRTAAIIRFAGLLLPVILIFYGLLIQLGAIQSDHFSGDAQFILIALVWIGLSVYQFLVPPKSKRMAAARLILFHILAAAYLLFVSGFDMPFTVGWVILLLASLAYFSTDGLYLSIFILFATALADILLHLENSNYIIQNILYFVGTLAVGYIVGSISKAQEVDREELSRSQAEELLQRDRMITIVNNLADAILSTDKNGVIQVYNAACLSLLDTNTGLEGQKIDAILPLVDKDNTPFKFIRELKAATTVQNRDDLSIQIAGEQLHLSVIYSPIRGVDSHGSDGSDGYIVILRDITKQKSLEEERDEFISVVSHELRTPITIAEGTLSNLQIMMDRNDIPDATLKDNMKVAHDQVLFLAKMVNDLSTLSRAERGVADAPEAIDVSALIHDLYNEYAPQAEAKGLHFNLDLSPQLGEVVASRLYLKELLQNFVTNAIKYTKEGEVVVRVKKHDDTLDFRVSDTGIGMSKSDQTHIFEKFWRSEDYRTRETGGTGLGLYVARKLSKKLDIQIEMSSRLNHGSTFGFTMQTTHKDPE